MFSSIFKSKKISEKTSVVSYPIKDYLYVTRVDDHNIIKGTLLDLISYEYDQSVNNDIDTISSTDFFVDNKYSTYKDYFNENVICKYYNSIMESAGINTCRAEWKLQTIWYQQYYHNDNHNWHVHGNSSYSNVYFLELPSNELTTEFFDQKTRKVIKIKGIREGDLLTFPAHLIHRSPKNKTTSRKTVIVFNVTMV